MKLRVALAQLRLQLFDPLVTPVAPHARRSARTRASWKAKNSEWSDLDHLRVGPIVPRPPLNGYFHSMIAPANLDGFDPAQYLVAAQCQHGAWRAIPSTRRGAYSESGPSGGGGSA